MTNENATNHKFGSLEQSQVQLHKKNSLSLSYVEKNGTVKQLSTSLPALIMGIVNVTPDSFGMGVGELVTRGLN